MGTALPFTTGPGVEAMADVTLRGSSLTRLTLNLDGFICGGSEAVKI